MESGTPQDLIQAFAPRGKGVCEAWCGRTEDTPYGCLGFGAKGTVHCDCVEEVKDGD